MGYTKSWTPATIPLRDDLTAWKAIITEIHDEMLLSGIAQTSHIGQLNLDDITVLPADGTFAGYRIYQFTDDLQAYMPIYMRLDFGCDIESLYTSTAYVRSRTLRIKIQVTSIINSDNTVGPLSSLHYNPQQYSITGGTAVAQLTQYGRSFITYNKTIGFLGFVFGESSRNNPLANSNGAYYGSSLSIFIQRTLDYNGEPNANGFSVYGSNLGYASGGLNYGDKSLSKLYHITDSTVTNDIIYGYRFGKKGEFSNYKGVYNVQPIMMEHPQLMQHPSLVSYYFDEIPKETQFQINTITGVRNFIAIGHYTGMSVATPGNETISLAMLYE